MERPNIDSLSNDELKALAVRLLERTAELERQVSALTEEIRRLKGLKGPPSIKPSSGMERATERRPAEKSKGGREDREPSKRVIHEYRTLKADVPAGSRFKGYEDFVVQDLVLRAHTICYRRERWLTPDGTVVAPLPAGITGHFGPEVRRLILALYHQGQMTVLRLLALLQGVGIAISKRQLTRLLISGHACFQAEARAVLLTGLQSAAWIQVDDTLARHRGSNGSCTYIGNDDFAWFGTTPSKGRGDFLELLRAGHTGYVINADALAYMQQNRLSPPLVKLLADHADKHFPHSAAWTAHLDRLGIMSSKAPRDPRCIATEGAVWGSIKAHGLLPDTVIVSDDAGRFNVGLHALCWVHAERLVHKLDTFTDQQHAAQQEVRARIWRLYRLLKWYRKYPTARRKAVLEARFDEIFARPRTGFVQLDRLLARLSTNKSELLRVLERPEIPVHTNGAENAIRCQVIRRKISGGTRSEAGLNCRDTFLTLAKTAVMFGFTFWDYLGARLNIPGHKLIPYLPTLLKHRCATS
jgi:hypothetical protein